MCLNNLISVCHTFRKKRDKEMITHPVARGSKPTASKIYPDNITSYPCELPSDFIVRMQQVREEAAKRETDFYKPNSTLNTSTLHIKPEQIRSSDKIRCYARVPTAWRNFLSRSAQELDGVQNNFGHSGSRINGTQTEMVRDSRNTRNKKNQNGRSHDSYRPHSDEPSDTSCTIDYQSTSSQNSGTRLFISKLSEGHNTSMQRVWKSALDPKSGKTYYYDTLTRETQWRKPAELTSTDEKKIITGKEQKQREFFSAMESNIMKAFAQGSIPGTPSAESDKLGSELSFSKRGNPKKLLKPNSVSIRTISSMNDTILSELVAEEDSSPTRENEKKCFTDCSIDKAESGKRLNAADDSWNPSLNWQTNSSLDADEAIARVKSAADSMARNAIACGEEAQGEEKKVQTKNRPVLSRRNTCSTLYVGTTMSAPDTDATIKCVCAVYRAHLLQSVKDETKKKHPTISFKEYDLFVDQSSASSKQTHRDHFNEETRIPTLDAITSFYRNIFLKSQMETDCIIMSLIYVEKLIKATNGGVRPKLTNWRSILFSSMIMASKVWDDLSMWNVDFIQTCPAGVTFSLQRVNELEMGMLNCLKFEVKVLASEYAKYYFLLRSMLIRSGLGGEDFLSSLPLDTEGAKKLEHNSANFQIIKSPSSIDMPRRVKSLGHAGTNNNSLAAGKESTVPKAVLEQVVNM